MKPLPLIAIVGTAVLCVSAVQSRAQSGQPFVIAESGEGFSRLQDAVDKVGNRSATIRIAPGRYADCAVQTQGRIAFVAVEPGTAIFDGRPCDDKAALVLRGQGARVEGLVFQNMAVNDGNGAGIRLEKGPLEVSESLFRDSQEGILTADDPASTLSIDKSTFAGLGRCDGDSGCAHALYVGRYGRVVVTRSRFERGTGGHYVKSRAIVNEVRDNSFDDTAGRGTNYMIDLPAGSTGTIAGNSFTVGRDKENHSAIIAVAAETRQNRSAGLRVADNDARLAPGIGWTTAFVADLSHEPLAIGINRLGPGIRVSEQR